MADYTRQLEKAHSQIRKKGEKCEYHRYAEARGNPWEVSFRDHASSTMYVYFIFTRAGQQSLYTSGDIVPRGGYTGIMAAQGFEPTLKDWVIRGTEQLSIKDVIVTKVNEQALLYNISFNRS